MDGRSPHGRGGAGLYAFLVSAFFYYRSISLATACHTERDSARSTAAIGILIAGALVFNYAVERIPNAIRGSLAETDVGMVVFLLMINVLLLLLGCLLEANTILLVIVPLFVPTAVALGVDPVHFGVIVVVKTMLGLAAPPYGLLLFVVSGITRTLRIWRLRFAATCRLKGGGHLNDITTETPAESGARSGGARPILVLNVLSTRQPEIHGHETLADVKRLCRETAAAHGLDIDFRQSDSEAKIIRWIQQARTQASSIVINPAGFTSTSIAILDALLMFGGQICECHISALFRREEFRHLSYVSKAATAKIEGFGISGYGFAITGIAQLLRQPA